MWYHRKSPCFRLLSLLLAIHWPHPIMEVLTKVPLKSNDDFCTILKSISFEFALKSVKNVGNVYRRSNHSIGRNKIVITYLDQVEYSSINFQNLHVHICLPGQNINQFLWPLSSTGFEPTTSGLPNHYFLGEIGLYSSMQTVATPELWLAAAALLAASPAVPKTFKLVGWVSQSCHYCHYLKRGGQTINKFPWSTWQSFIAHSWHRLGVCSWHSPCRKEVFLLQQP